MDGRFGEPTDRMLFFRLLTGRSTQTALIAFYTGASQLYTREATCVEMVTSLATSPNTLLFLGTFAYLSSICRNLEQIEMECSPVNVIITMEFHLKNNYSTLA